MVNPVEVVAHVNRRGVSLKGVMLILLLLRTTTVGLKFVSFTRTRLLSLLPGCVSDSVNSVGVFQGWYFIRFKYKGT
ncbi:hypothetical protein Hanom_Chr00s000004g01606841 [Helianthus anomalus]